MSCLSTSPSPLTARRKAARIAPGIDNSQHMKKQRRSRRGSIMSEATEQVISGLEGVLACESSIAYIDGSVPELSFRGYDIHDIAQTLTFEQVAFLIWHDRIPTADELRAFSSDLAGRRAIPRPISDVLRATPSAAHPMAGLRTTVSMLGAMDPRAEDISPEDN